MGLWALLSRATIRTRVMGAIVLVALLALLVSGAVVLVLSLHSTHEAIDARFTAARDGVQRLAIEQVDPVSGEVLDSPEKVLQAYLRRSALGPAEGELGIVDGRLRWLAPASEALRPEADAALVGQLSTISSGDLTHITTLTTSKSKYRVLVVPISDGTKSVAYVRVADLALAEAGDWQTLRVFSLAAGGAVAFVAALAWFVVERLLRPIGELRRATEEIHEQDLTTRVRVHGRDDLSLLADAVNRMLDRVQNAVESQRELLDDVGHELRTPITVVRGHLELLDANDPQDVERTSALAIDELDRMGVLVGDLLALAKSAQSDYIHPEPTDVEELTLQVLDKASALGERCWRLDACAQTFAELDPARVTQAWLQLVSNAVRYSAAGSVVSLGSRVEGDHVLLWVQDEGIGISPTDLPLIRQRFTRTAQAQSMTKGYGLGLSIVENIVQAHAGSLDIESVQGEGSVFTLRLPLTATARKHPQLGEDGRE